MLLYNCWLEDTENTIDKHEHTTTLTHEADWGHDDAGNDGEGGDGAGGLDVKGNSKGGKGKGGGTGKGGKGKGKGGGGDGPTKLKTKKEKTPNQLARAVSCFTRCVWFGCICFEIRTHHIFWNSKCVVVSKSKAVATANNNILEVSSLNMKLTKAGVLLIGNLFSRESIWKSSAI